MQKLALIAAALVDGFGSMACNTVQGVGRASEPGGVASPWEVK